VAIAPVAGSGVPDDLIAAAGRGSVVAKPGSFVTAPWAVATRRAAEALRWIAPVRLVLLMGAVGSVLHTAERAAWPLVPIRWAWWVSLAACGLMMGIAWRSRRGRWRWPIESRRAALWIEEQGVAPPDFSLVTAVELDTATVSEGLDRAAAARLHGFSLSAALWRERRVAWMGPALLLGGSLLLGAASSPKAGAVVSGHDGATPVGLVPSMPLGAWQVVVQPPAYTGQSAQALGDVALVRALPGSVLRMSGEGLPPTVDGATDAPIEASAGGWLGRWVTAARPMALRLSRGGRTRQLLVEPLTDSTPRVRLILPARDTVLRVAEGQLRLEAEVADDLGLRDAAFDLLVTSGEGERFTVKPVRLAAVRWRSADAVRGYRMRTTLSVGALGLGPGDVVHLRAVGRDHQPDSVRQLGTSETRAFRIARAAEYDSVAVEAAAPLPVDSSRLSQRMLLRLTEKLDARQTRMGRSDVLRESGRLARDQGKLRQQIGDLVFQRLSGESPAEHAHAVGDGHDHGVDVQGGRLTALLDEGNDAPVIAVNQPLLEAYNAMWDAGRALEIGDPHGAIPAMRRALVAIEKARAASRVYLRGTPPRVILDLARIRLAGRDTGRSAPRPSRATEPLRAPEFDARLVRAVRLAVTPSVGSGDPQAARDSLAVLRLEAVADAPAFAAAVERLLGAMARGGDITAEVLTARRVLGIVERAPVSTWSRMPGGAGR